MSMAGVESATQRVLVMDRTDIYKREDEARLETGGCFATSPNLCSCSMQQNRGRGQ